MSYVYVKISRIETIELSEVQGECLVTLFNGRAFRVGTSPSGCHHDIYEAEAASKEDGAIKDGFVVLRLAESAPKTCSEGPPISGHRVGRIIIQTCPSAFLPPPMQVREAAPTIIANAGPQVGDKMEDGTIFAGISPDTNAPMYACPSDEPLTMKWKQAMDYAEKFEGHGHPAGTFRVTTRDELNVLLENRAKIGGFDETGSNPYGWYWSSTQHDDDTAYDQRYSGSDRTWDIKTNHSSVRLVRS